MAHTRLILHAVAPHALLSPLPPIPLLSAARTLHTLLPLRCGLPRPGPIWRSPPAVCFSVRPRQHTCTSPRHCSWRRFPRPAVRCPAPLPPIARTACRTPGCAGSGGGFPTGHFRTCGNIRWAGNTAAIMLGFFAAITTGTCSSRLGVCAPRCKIGGVVKGG